MIAISVYDLRHTIIPDSWVYALIAVSFLYALTLFPTILPFTFWLLFLDATITALPLFLLWAISRGAWMGFGDVKLCLAIGLILGWPMGLFAVLFSFIIGAGVLVPLIYLPKVIVSVMKLLSPKSYKLQAASWSFGLTMKSEVAFGPFLIAATLFVWLSQLNDPFLLFGLLM